MEEEKSAQMLEWPFPLGRIYLSGFWDTKFGIFHTLPITTYLL